MLLEILIYVAMPALIIILIRPSILKFFFKRPNRIKGFLFWLIVYPLLFYIIASTPLGQAKYKELDEKRKAEMEEDPYPYVNTKPDTAKKDDYWRVRRR